MFLPRITTMAAAVLAASLPASAFAVGFELGPFEGKITSNFSVGASWRTEDASNRVLSPGNTNGEGRGSSSTADDGNLNYDKGDMYSMLFKGVHDLDLNADTFGFFARVKYWYDYELAEGKVDHGHAATSYAPGEELNTSGFEDLAQDSGFELLDYYAYGSFELGDKPVELRAGSMVLSWGESTFIQNGVNVINPFDVTALRSPGSEIKEALLPVGMVYGNIGLTYDLSVEAFYQYEWKRTVVDECGTYWSSADPYGGGCNYLTASNTSSDLNQTETNFTIPRSRDQEASDSGQWGIAARYIDLYGLTFATNVGDWAVSGELSYRPDFPLQINTVDLLHSVALSTFGEWSPMLDRSLEAGPGGYVAGYDDVTYTQFQMTFIKFFEQVMGAERLSFAAEAGGIWLGDMDSSVNYGRSAAYGVADFDPFVSELFGVDVSCNSHPALGPLGVVPNTNPEYCNKDGFTDDFSWGYRVRAGLDYSDVFAGINLTPSLAWSHDVKGNSPPPNFIEDRMALSLGLRADYLNIYRADVSYTTFFNADYNELEDRDFVSLSFSMAF